MEDTHEQNESSDSKIEDKGPLPDTLENNESHTGYTWITLVIWGYTRANEYLEATFV